VLAGLCLLANAASALTVTVTSNLDSGPGTLRQAIQDANASPGPDLIQFDMASVVSPVILDSQLIIQDDLTIAGPGSDHLTVSGNSVTRVFQVSGGTVSIVGLTIANGHADSGGGVRNAGAELILSNCTLSGTSAQFFGGGAYNSGYLAGAELTIASCTMSGNSAGYGGGGACNDGSYGSALLTITDSTLNGNSAADFGGGGVYNYSDSGLAETSVTNCTVSGNSATNYYGGAAYNGSNAGSAKLSISHSTVAGNSAYYIGGGVFNGDEMTISHTLMANGATGGNNATYSLPVISGGYNIADDGSLALTGAGDQNDVTNLGTFLGPLADNGGPTQTQALLELAGNPAIDGGNPGFDGSALPYDQRGVGFPRVDGTAVDVGAFEVQGGVSPVDLINDLIDAVNALQLPNGTRNALVVKLNAAIVALEAGKTSAACARLQDFINLAKAQSGKKLTKNAAAWLIAEAKSIRMELGCP